MERKAIGFDYGGVIAGISGPVFNKQISKILGVDLETFQNVYFQFNHLPNKGILSWPDFWKKISDELGVSDKYESLMEYLRGLPKIETNQQMLSLVDRLRYDGYRVGLLSNNDKETANKLRETGLIDHFDIFLVSAETGFIKPDPKIFELFTKQLGVEASELVYIDDTEKSLSTANEVGYIPILFSTYDQLVLDLKKLGIKT